MELPGTYSGRKLSELSEQSEWVKSRRLETMAERQKFHTRVFTVSAMAILGNSLYTPTHLPLNIILAIICAGTGYAYLLARKNHGQILGILGNKAD